mmetsp:Transcript_17280/g.40670  ORF Transcript_17280/g.40670 Transcript_17280/m.40670 type:complete len:113 (+) Transcript_17280:2-340(+)
MSNNETVAALVKELDTLFDGLTGTHGPQDAESVISNVAAHANNLDKAFDRILYTTPGEAKGEVEQEIAELEQELKEKTDLIEKHQHLYDGWKTTFSQLREAQTVVATMPQSK